MSLERADKFTWGKGGLRMLEPPTANRAQAPDPEPSSPDIKEEIRKIFSEFLIPKRPPGQVHYEARHAPKGGVTIGGTFYTGGEWIPSEVAESAEGQSKLNNNSGQKENPPSQSEVNKYPEMNDRSAKAIFKNIHNNMSTKEKYSFIAYRSSDYYDINNHLRGKIAYIHPELKDIISEMDNVMAKSRLPESLSSYRGMNGTAFENIFGVPPSEMESCVGVEFTDGGFGSTSLDRRVSQGFARDNGVLALVRVPAGYPAIYLPPPDYPNEQELLLDRGTKYRISAVKSGVMILDVLPKEASP